MCKSFFLYFPCRSLVPIHTPLLIKPKNKTENNRKTLEGNGLEVQIVSHHLLSQIYCALVPSSQNKYTVWRAKQSGAHCVVDTVADSCVNEGLILSCRVPIAYYHYLFLLYNHILANYPLVYICITCNASI